MLVREKIKNKLFFFASTCSEVDNLFGSTDESPESAGRKHYKLDLKI